MNSKAILLFALTLGIVVIGLLAPLSPLTAQDMSEVEITTEDLGGGIFMLTGRGGNMGLCVGDDGVFLVDDQFAPLTKKILTAIKEVSDLPVQFLVNTHWHFDHTGGNENMGNTGVLIVAHENVRERMSTDQFSKFLDRKTAPSPAAALPVVTFDDGVTFHLNGETVEVVHVSNAHTDGDAFVYFANANVIHMGDIYFNGLYPFIDTESGGSFKGMVQAAERALAMMNTQTKVIPGHGPISTKAEFKTYRDMLATILERVGKAVAEGKDLEEIQKLNLTQEWDDPLGKVWITPEQLVEFAYQDFTQ